MSLLDRHLRAILEDRLLDEPVIVVQGPRGVGKTTTLELVAEQRGVDVINLADEETAAVGRAAPSDFLANRPEPVLIDEFQRLPGLLPVIKRSVDDRRRPGAFVLTGSTTRLMPRGSESLAGRSHEMTLWGFSQGELRGRREGFVDCVFDDPRSLLAYRSTDERSLYVEAVAQGGFPEAVARTREDARRRWQLDYARRIADRDLADLVSVRRPRLLTPLLRAAAARTAQTLNVTDLAEDLGAGRDIVDTYLSLLEAIYIVTRVPAFSRNLNARLARHPKIHVNDAGLATALCGLSAATLRRSTQFGPLLETFVIGEVTKQLGWSSAEADLFHYRDRDGHEVDLVLQSLDGRVVGIEVKAATSVDRSDARGLLHLADLLGPDFVHGVVLFTGRDSVRLSDDARITAHPVSVLWA